MFLLKKPAFAGFFGVFNERSGGKMRVFNPA
jgi:hypothetical protein